MADAFPPLPRPDTTGGQPRRTGVEIEFGSLTEDEAAGIVARALGGTVQDDGPYARHVTDTPIGDVEILLDTTLRRYGGKSALARAGLDAARVVVPVELVSEPLDPAGLARLDGVRDALRRAGSTGTTDGALLGFGVHLNVEVVAPDDPFTLDTVLAYGLLEDWLRREWKIDLTRRALPFVNPWRRGFVSDLIAAGRGVDLATLRRLYLRHMPSRNHGLDLLPLLKAADKTAFARDFDDAEAIKGRPAFHFRLPDCRIDDPDWSLAVPWDAWRRVEALADRPDLLARLCAAWCDGGAEADRTDWADTVGRMLDADAPEP